MSAVRFSKNDLETHPAPATPFSFGTQLRTFRQRAGLSQAALAERAGISVATLTALERNQRQRPHPHTLATLAEALGLSPTERERLLTPALALLAQPGPVVDLGGTPGASSQAAAHAVLPPFPRAGAGAPRPAWTGRTPGSLTPLVGREHELTELRQQVASARLVTLTGPGGIGKTRLALALAGTAEPMLADVVWLVSLEDLADPLLLPQAVASAVAAPQSDRPDVDELVEVVRGRRGLLVLDTCEHLIDACAGLAEVLLGACPDLRVLATSREPLGLMGEVVWAVPPLGFPRASTATPQVFQSAAVRLFVERATAAQPDFEVTHTSAASLVEVCQRLEGIPLALELAAAWVRVLSLDELAVRLANQLEILVGGSRTAPPRQQTVRGAIEWSYSLLSDAERRVLMRLSIFSGGWTLTAAEAVCAGDGVRPHEVLRLLRQLVDKSLVVVDDEPDRSRYRLLETIREYAGELLGRDPSLAEVRERLVRWAERVAEDAARELASGRESNGTDQMERELASLRAALTLLAEQGDAARGMRLASCLGWYWMYRGPVAEGRRWFTTFLSLEHARVPADVRAVVTAWAARLAIEAGDVAAIEALETARSVLGQHPERLTDWLQATEHLAYALNVLGEFERADQLAIDAIDLARATDQPYWLATFLQRRAYSAMRRGQDELASACARESAELASRLGFDRLAAWSAHILGLLGARDDGADAIQALMANLGAHRAAGDRRGVVSALVSLGAACAAHDAALAAHWFREGLDEAQRIGYWHGQAYCVAGVAAAAVRARRFAAAVRLHQQLEPYIAKVRATIPPQMFAGYCAAIAAAAQQVTVQADAPTELPAWSSVCDQARELANELTPPHAQNSASCDGSS